MTLINPSFEDGWKTLIDGNQQPNGWLLDYPEVGASLLAPKAGNGDAVQDVRCVPECVHKLDWQLPADEQPGGDDALILDGSTTYKVFGASAFRATLAQQFEVAKGAKCKLVVPVQVHGHLNPDTGQPYNIDTGAAYWRVTINGYPGKWYTFNDDFQDRTWWMPEKLFTAVYGTVCIFIEFECHTLGGVDYFIDHLQFECESVPEQPTNTIPVGGYDRTYWVVPSVYTTPERRDYIYTLAAAMQYTVGPSADDSRAWATELIDAGNTVTAVVWDVPEADKDAWEDYYFSREPRMVIEFRGGDPTSPPTGGEPIPIEHYTGNFIGLHSATLKQGWDTYALDAHPNLMKVFSCGDAVRAKAIQPEMLVVWRHHVGNDGGYLEGDIKADALKVLDMYSIEINTHAQAANMTETEVLKYVDVLESINETYPSFNTDHLLRAIDFDLWFSEHLHERYGDNVFAGIFTAAVGNPHESEFSQLLPLAQVSHEQGDYLTYHTYWGADKTYSYLIPHWKYHAGRWQEMDKVFVEHGFYPNWYFGEAGICYTIPESGGWAFVPSEGWKSCGPFSEYIDDIELFNTLLADWNDLHGGRCYGATLFAYGGWGWDSFNFEPGDLLELSEVLATYA